MDLPAGVPVAVVKQCRDGSKRELRKLMSRLTAMSPR